MIEYQKSNEPRILQGDIYSNIEYIENLEIVDKKISLSKIIFPLVYVLSQDCDLNWDYDNRIKDNNNQDKYLFSIILTPLYNYNHFINGDHLSELEQKMSTISKKPTKTDNKNLRNNQNPRYHYLAFDENIWIPDSVIDFKHYFTINTIKLLKIKRKNYVCTINPLYRKLISQRFANFLSRIGLPNINDSI